MYIVWEAAIIKCKLHQKSYKLIISTNLLKQFRFCFVFVNLFLILAVKFLKLCMHSYKCKLVENVTEDLKKNFVARRFMYKLNVKKLQNPIN